MADGQAPDHVSTARTRSSRRSARPTRSGTAGGRSSASARRSAALTGRSRRSSAACKAGREAAATRGSRDAAGGTRSSGAARQRLQVGFGPAPDRDPRLPQGHRPRPRPPAPGGQGPRQDDHRQARRLAAGTWSCPATTCPPSRWSPTGAVVGIDMGIASFLTTSDGEARPEPAPAGRGSRAARRRPAGACPQEARQQPQAQGRPQGRRAAWQGPPHRASTTPTRPHSPSSATMT